MTAFRVPDQVYQPLALARGSGFCCKAALATHASTTTLEIRQVWAIDSCKALPTKRCVPNIEALYRLSTLNYVVAGTIVRGIAKEDNYGVQTHTKRTLL